jgi:hypothetical protein
MIGRDDLRAAVASGILSERQAAHLASLADSRRGAREGLDPGDEPFELFKGFNEIFIVVGLVILASGWLGVMAVSIGDAVVNLPRRAAIVAVIGGVILWLLSEYFVRSRRMVAPAITLSVFFAANAVMGAIALLAQPFMVAQNDFSSIPLPLAAATVALLVYWLRFKVPFAMALIALGLFATAMVLVANRAGSPDSLSDLFLLSAGGPFAWITLILGLLVFCVAMMFDMSDPHRVTRRSANGFWLHVVAAPALVNTVALTLLERDTAGANMVLVLFLALIALVAIVIDRRSFLIAGVGYSVTLAATVFGGNGAALTILILGMTLVLLGAFWERIRARLLRLLPGAVPLHRLPPSV